MRKDRVLIVDDEPSARTGLARLISSWNYKTEAAEDGNRALALIPQFEPDVVVTDMVMPGMDGMTLLKRINENHAGLTVILLTRNYDQIGYWWNWRNNSWYDCSSCNAISISID